MHLLEFYNLAFAFHLLLKVAKSMSNENIINMYVFTYIFWTKKLLTYVLNVLVCLNRIREDFLHKMGLRYIFEIDFIKNRISYPSPSDVWCWSPCGLTGKGNLASHIFDVFVVGSAEQSWWVFDNDLNNWRRGCASPLIERLTWILTRMLLGDLQNKW